MRARRGFTLVELMVTLTLVVGALVVVGGIELGAQRSVALQQALLDMQRQAGLYLARVRRDVEQARTLELQPERLRVVRLDGVEVVYVAGERREREQVERFGSIEELAVSSGAVAEEVVVTIRCAAPLGRADVVRREFRRVATPRGAIDAGSDVR